MKGLPADAACTDLQVMETPTWTALLMHPAVLGKSVSTLPVSAVRQAQANVSCWSDLDLCVVNLLCCSSDWVSFCYLAVPLGT